MRTSQFARLAALFLLLPLDAALANEAAAKLGLNLSSEKPEVFERVEISVAGVPASPNPFDPE